MKRIALLTLTFLVSCTPVMQGERMNRTVAGTATGTALGAGIGAIVGDANGHAGRGTAVGAGLGALAGALVGGALEGQAQEQEFVEDRLARNEQELSENRRLIEELRLRGADARESTRGVVVNLPDILFEFDRADLTVPAFRTIDDIAEVVSGVGQRSISVEGHTDAVGSVTYNRELSIRRAQSVARALSSAGVARQRMAVEGYGEGSPIATNNTDYGRAQNRRVEVIIENR